ncbi:MAG: leucyl/phenylalanyl-tRNA/protein transferase [Sphingobacteriaceae bacterium]|jgi:leucyl/phenylalanyl-tRNA--protein transferase|nr:leucyl/phenylalanyl-tRNA/protein transferase [Sphingobacteriaceae bacterium]
MIFRLLDDDISFPDPRLAEEDGLLAVEGDLSIPRLLLAYQLGIFPWYSEETPILWYSPHQRFVLYPNKVKVSKSMRQVLNSGKFTITFDQAFEDVIRECAQVERRDQPGTWLTDEMQEAYIELHRLGYAHSVETWENGELVGGLYGVAVNNVFCGESMFSKTSNASKAALIWLCRNKDYELIDCQVHTEHLESMGAGFISRAEYMKVLKSC